MSQVSKTNDAIESANLHEIECQREEETLDLSRARFERNQNHLNEHNRGGDSQVGRVIENRLCGPLADAIAEFIDPKDKPRGWNAGSKAAMRGTLKSLGLTPLEISYCTLKAVLNELFRKDSSSLLSSHCGSITDNLLVCAEFKEFKASDKRAAVVMTKRVKAKKGGLNNLYGAKTMRTARELSGLPKRIRLAAGERLQLGAKLIELLIASTGAFHLRKEYRGRNDTPMLLEASDELLKLVQVCSDRFAELAPQYRAMVIPPKPWKNLYNGGYILPISALHPSLVKQRRAELKRIERYDLSHVYEAVNAIQNTRWRINAPVLEVAQALWNMGGGIGGIPQCEDKTPPPFPWADLSKEEFAVWKADHQQEYRKWADAAQAAYKFNRSLSAARLRVSYQLRIAKENLPFDVLYFPHTCDFRGRVYPLPSYVNPQSDDLGKALLTFADGKELTAQGAYWLTVHVANCAGVDKVSFEERVMWVRAHEREIVSYAESPLDNLGWTDADTPFQFLAACFEYAGYLREGEKYRSHLPVAMDGTCNGLQHLSAMLRDEIGGAAVNLVPAMQPSDIYTEVLEQLRKILTDEVEHAADPTDRLMAEEWLPKLVRSVTKRPVMTTPYGVSGFGIRDQILEQINAEGWFTGHVIPYTEWAKWLTKRMQRAIAEVIVAAPHAMGFLQESSRIISEADKEQRGISWVVPGSGFPVIQRYLAPTGELINMFIGKQRIRCCTGELNERHIEARRQTSGISPNVIHSLDAAMLMLTVNKLKTQGIEHFALIHDSYGTHACDIPVLHQILREQFAEIYCNHDILAELKSLWENEFNVLLPELPAQGSLDPKMVNYSRYFFA